ncbi:MAG: hypothetical protein R3D67_03415 [Hyphomicrobiaceae bacterium]
MAADADPARITSREALMALGVETIEAVAHEMNPGRDDPVWNFTVPEALTLVERVAGKLRPLVVDAVPLGDRLTVGQVMALYKWRGMLDLGTQAYDLWRILRLMNPLAAATQEIRERLSKSIYEGLRQELASGWQVPSCTRSAKAAIDLCSGRLRGATSDVQPPIWAQRDRQTKRPSRSSWRVGQGAANPASSCTCRRGACRRRRPARHQRFPRLRHPA